MKEKTKQTLTEIMNWIPIVGDIQDLCKILKTRKNSYAHDPKLWEWHYHPGDNYRYSSNKRMAIVGIGAILLGWYGLNDEIQKSRRMQEENILYSNTLIINSNLESSVGEK